MRAFVLQGISDPAQVQLSDAIQPEPGATEVVVRIQAAALNHRDLYICKGQYGGLRFPIIPGSDGVGVVTAVGADVTTVTPGAAVIINPSLEWGNDPAIPGPQWRILGLPDNGTLAEYVAVPAANVYARPEYLTVAETAATPLAGLTAYRAVATIAQMQRGETLLVTGIGGGVATFALLFAQALGVRVFVTSGTDAKIEQAQALGAVAGFNYRTTDWVKATKAATQGKGVDAVIDGTGGAILDGALDAVRTGGRVVSYGATLGATPELSVRRIFWKHVQVRGTSMGSAADFAAMLNLMSSQQLHPVVAKVFPLAEVGAALTYMENAEQFGKIVLQVE